MDTAELNALAAFLRPFLLLVICFVILYPARKAVEKWMPDGKFKRFLLWEKPW
jgi:hypothetical protein